MSGIARSRILSNLWKTKTNRSFCSTNPPKEAIISSQSLLNDQPPPPTSSQKKSWNFLKFTLSATLVGAAATACYASYAYTLEEVDQKTSALRESAKYTVGDGASTLDKIEAFLYSAAMTVPAKTAELYTDTRRSIEEHVRGFTEPSSEKLLPDLLPQEQHVFTLVLDLNETLIYSDWKRERGWRTFKRPGVDVFLEHLAQFYEIVIYSDQLSMYVDPIIERLDQKGCIRYRLSRSATRYVNGKHYRGIVLSQEEEDSLYWGLSESGILSVHSFYTSLRRLLLSPTIWRVWFGPMGSHPKSRPLHGWWEGGKCLWLIICARGASFCLTSFCCVCMMLNQQTSCSCIVLSPREYGLEPFF
ncbi:mitochondrial import inner membrane translocase subunit TIM50 isoform X1 [Magnolia sinica]|uniref:mitochondrial import inner membrane translocase subunit TIM50 isoform X1 n=1 Tax=Magnolia sinica TaxID=86752 RepID=UPI00265998BA|nr:mitochondrial import inner membrane translocase subunit TIM50 isoform X1 [Magnolia sinica]